MLNGFISGYMFSDIYAVFPLFFSKFKFLLFISQFTFHKANYCGTHFTKYNFHQPLISSNIFFLSWSTAFMLLSMDIYRYVDVSTVDGTTSKLISGHIKSTGASFLEASCLLVLFLKYVQCVCTISFFKFKHD